MLENCRSCTWKGAFRPDCRLSGAASRANFPIDRYWGVTEDDRVLQRPFEKNWRGTYIRVVSQRGPVVDQWCKRWFPSLPVLGEP